MLDGRDQPHSASPFNVKADSLTRRNFTLADVVALYAQHTGDTGQRFDDEVTKRAFALTGGQPWLVNAIARQLVQMIALDRAEIITAADVEQAKEQLIRRQDTQGSSLVEDGALS